MKTNKNLVNESRAIISSPIGQVELTQKGGAITRIQVLPNSSSVRGSLKMTPLLRAATKQIREYFSGSRFDFDFPICPEGTDFQKQVWEAAKKIPHSELRTYSEIAKKIKRPKAVRAVGQALGRNPILLVVPCHRVIGSQGKLTGFAAGIGNKEWLLDFEGAPLYQGAQA